MTAARTITPAP